MRRSHVHVGTARNRVRPLEGANAEPSPALPREGAKSCEVLRRGRTLAAMLGERDKAVLEFEGSWWLYPGPKDRAIREHLGMSATRYYQVLRRLLDDEEADGYAPLVVRRLRRIREDDRRRRLEERIGGPQSGG